MLQRLIWTMVLVVTGCGPSVSPSRDTDSTTGEATSDGSSSAAVPSTGSGGLPTGPSGTATTSGAATSSTTTGPSTSGELPTTGPTSGSESSSSGESSESGGEPEPPDYGPCDEGQCPSEQTCANAIDGTGNVCVSPCGVGARCAAPTSGDVNPSCVPTGGGGAGLCALPCNVVTSMCPDGMDCSPLDPDGSSPMGLCVWPFGR